MIVVLSTTTVEGKCHRRFRIVSISSGTSFGKCFGYCQKSINITLNPLEIHSLKQTNSPQFEYPMIRKQDSFSLKQWNELLDLVHSKGFRSLDNVIGCPDCADGGAEWIEITWPDINKRVTFQYGKSIEHFQEFIDHLRELRKEYLD